MKKLTNNGVSVYFAFITCVIILLIACVTAPVSADAAEETVVFVNTAAGSDSNTGGETSPLKTLTRAIRVVGEEGGVIVLTDTISVTANYTEPAHKGAIVITTKYGDTDYAASGACLLFTAGQRYYLSGETTFRDITMKSSGEYLFAANFNPITFDTGVEMVNTTSTNTKNVYVIGGYQTPDDATLPVGLDSHITIRSGNLYKIVCGFSRTRGAAGTMYFTGTSHIAVEGGELGGIYGGSIANHGAGSTVITITGGKVDEIYTGGDVTRRLFGGAEVNLLGGTVTAVNINNVTEDVYVNLKGAVVSSLDVTYYNDTLAGYAEDAGSVKYLYYNGFIYSQEFINQCIPKFDVTKNLAQLYVERGASGNGYTPQTPMCSIADGMSAAAENGGEVIVMGKYTLSGDYWEPSHNGKINIIGYDSGSELEFTGDSSYILGGPTSFDDIKISHTGSLVLSAEGNKLGFGGGVTVDNPFGVYIYGGRQGQANYTSERIDLELEGGQVEKVVGIASSGYSGPTVSVNINLSGIKAGSVYAAFENGGMAEGSVSVVVNGGEVENLYSSVTGTITGDFTLRHNGGSTGNISLSGISAGVRLNFADGSVGAVEAYGWEDTQQPRILKYSSPPFVPELFNGITGKFDSVTSGIFVYVRDGERGSGSSPMDAAGSLTDAYAAIGNEDGTIVICGTYTVSNAVYAPSHKGRITITSFDSEMDYRSTGALIHFAESYYCGGETLFENLRFEVSQGFKGIIGDGHKLTLGEGISSRLILGNTGYICIIGGSNDTDEYSSADITIKSGEWGRVRGGSSTASSSDGVEIRMDIYGGTFYDYVTAGGAKSINGNIDISIYGGTFYKGFYGMHSSQPDYLNGEVNIVIYDGTFYGYIAPAVDKTSILSGEWNVFLEGGDFTHLTDLEGTGGYGGDMESHIYPGDALDINEVPIGSLTFTNYIKTGADPWIFYHEGYYYLTVTGAKAVYLYKAANLSDLAYVRGKVIFDPPEGREFSTDMWSPEIHYFTDEQAGEGNGGWYMFVGCSDGNAVNNKMYVVKCLTDDLLGEWGDPLTGEANIPRRVISRDDSSINADGEMSGGMSSITINGMTYILWIGEEGRGTETFHQVIYINRMLNPWTLIGEKAEICYPEYSWEKQGYGYDVAKNDWYPMVVEGATAVYGDNGEVYIVYSGSGYWTKYYQLGKLKYIGGDPLRIESWQKSPDPIFSLSDSINGCGHASYVTDAEGNRWICYHAYTGTDTSIGRFVFLEPYEADADGVRIGNGTGHPANIDTPYTINVNPMTLKDKISGFHHIGYDLTITTDILPEGIKKVGYSSGALSVYGGITPYIWSAAGLPEGLSIDTVTGEVYGIPTAIGTYDVHFTVTDSVYQYAGKDIKLNINPAPLTIATDVLTDGVKGVAYSSGVLSAGGGMVPYIWSAEGLPAGLSINTVTGEVYGIPTVIGAYNVRFIVTDSVYRDISKDISLTINPPNPGGNNGSHGNGNNGNGNGNNGNNGNGNNGNDGNGNNSHGKKEGKNE